jgi:hypothetical protein
MCDDVAVNANNTNDINDTKKTKTTITKTKKPRLKATKATTDAMSAITPITLETKKEKKKKLPAVVNGPDVTVVIPDVVTFDAVIDDVVTPDVVTGPDDDVIVVTGPDVVTGTDDVDNVIIADSSNIDAPAPPTETKKRGRRPKGGKIIKQTVEEENKNEKTAYKSNIILHLKCSLKDIASHNSFFLANNAEFCCSKSKTNLSYEILDGDGNDLNVDENENEKANVLLYKKDQNDKEEIISGQMGGMKGIWKKIKSLEYNLNTNNCKSKSACFWCTFDFDNPSIHIPKYAIKQNYTVYGCFCSPECATAYLMNESIDSSVKFERYYLLNHIYGKVYGYKKNIKPAPNPHYMLEKFFGNLSIQEYRLLLNSDSEKLFILIDKPLTKLLPEYHEDNNDFIINNKLIPSTSSYQSKKKGLKPF